MNLKASCSIITIAMCLATILSKPVSASASFFHAFEHIGEDILDEGKKFIAHPIDTIEDDLKTVEQKAVDIAVNGFIPTIIGGLPSGDISTSTSSRSSSESDKQYKPNIVEHIPSLIMQSITKESIKSYG